MAFDRLIFMLKKKIDKTSVGSCYLYTTAQHATVEGN